MLAEEIDERIVQNLKDAGCDSEIVMRFLQLQEDGRTGDQLCLLAGHRKKLLDDLHGGQAKLDCLDYLIHHMKQRVALGTRKT